MYHQSTPTKSGALVAPANIRAICAARDAALAKMHEGADALTAAYAMTKAAAETAKAAHGGWRSYRDDRREQIGIDGLFAGQFDSAASLEAYRRDLDSAIWSRLLEETGLRRIMDSKEREEMDASMRGDVPPATLENITATIQRLMGDADLIWRRGLARTFAQLDRRFRSHDGFKIGSRIILTHVFNDWGGFNYGDIRQTLYDVERAFALLDVKPDRAGELEVALGASRRSTHRPRQDETETSYFRVRGFKNGNAHLWMINDDLVRKVNKVLGEYYGEVLADAAPKQDRPEHYRPKSTAVAADLAFYPTPADAVDVLLDGFYPADGDRVLEPSAGIGNIVKALLTKPVIVDAIEIHPGRSDTLVGMANPLLKVTCANFLQVRASPVYDWVMMNPPFAGKHYMDHVRHAFDFLKPGGELRAILPASAQVNETPAHERFRAWAEMYRPNWRGQWRELPPESFAEVGVRINTVVLTLKKPLA